MLFVKLSTRFYTDPKVASLPDAETEMAFVRSLAYCGSEETEGFIPANIVPTLFRRRRYEASVRALEDACLWTPVCDGTDRHSAGKPTGWRVNRWQDWQQELDALARRRSSDRDRKRREREAKKPQVKPMSRDTSRDRPADVTPPKREREKKISYGDFRRGAYVTNARDSPPPRKCSKHENDPDPPNCGACADARREHDTWQAEHAEQLEAQRLADIVRVRACPHCDADGWAYEPGTRRPQTPYVRCAHPEAS